MALSSVVFLPKTEEPWEYIFYNISDQYSSKLSRSIKRSTFDSVLVRWINLEPILESKISQKGKYCILNAYIWNLERWYWWNFLQGSNGDADRERTSGHREGRRWWDELREQHWNIHLTMCKLSQWKFAVWCRELKTGDLWQPWEVGWGGRWERGSRWRGHTYIYG